VGEEVEVEVHEVAVFVEEDRRAELEAPPEQGLLDPASAAHRAARASGRVPSEAGGLARRKKLGQLSTRGPREPRRRVLPEPVLQTDARVRVELQRVRGRPASARRPPRRASGALQPQRAESAPARARLVVVAGHVAAEDGGSFSTLRFRPHSPSPETPNVEGGAWAEREGELPGQAEARERRPLERLGNEGKTAGLARSWPRRERPT